MIYFMASVRAATAASDDAITSGSVGIPVALDLAPAFAGLAKTLVFTDGTVSVDVALVGDAVSAVVPHEVLATPMRRLMLGIWAADGEGNVVIPTIWADAGLICRGAAPSGVDPSDPTPSWVAQVQGMASDALEKAQAVETAAEQGDFDGADGYSPTVDVEDITGGHRVTITDVNGPHTFDVMDGQGGGGGAGALWAVYGTTTSSQIEAAYQAGSVCLCAYGSNIYSLAYRDSAANHTFCCVIGNVVYYVRCTSDSWTNGSLALGTYSKPSGGIPKTDLSNAVQNSLGKADTALQNAPVTSVNGATGAVTLSIPETAMDIGAIPLPETVDFGDVLTYIQSDEWAARPLVFPVQSVNSKTGAVSLSASDVGAVASNQGSGNAGKWLKIDSDGSVIAASLPTYNGGVS